MKNKICGVPFSEVSIYSHPCDSDKLIFMSCCPNWLEPPYTEFSVEIPQTESGDINLGVVWNSEKMINLRKSIASGEYTFCKKDRCPNIIGNNFIPLPKRAQELIDKNIYELDYPPICVHMAIDNSCNLQCPSCRRDHIVHPNPKTGKWIESILDFGIEYIGFNYNGEAFNNYHFLNFMRNFKKEKYPSLKKVDLITNGIQFDQKMWESLSDDFKDIINYMTVSVDAATEETYNKIRVRGDFQKVCQNLKFLGQLKKNGKIKYLTISFVLQKLNRHEILEFAKMIIDIGASSVAICRIENWIHYSKEEFKEKMDLPDNFLIENKEKIQEIKRMINNAGLLFFNNIE